MQCKWLTPDNWARIQTDFASGVGLREIAALLLRGGRGRTDVSHAENSCRDHSLKKGAEA